MDKKSVKLFLSMIILLTISLSIISAAYTHVISNSEEWEDVYSIMHYANLKSVGSSFLVSPRHAPLLLNGLNKNNEIRVISSESSSLYFDYADLILDNNFADAEEIYVDNANLELIDDLPEVRNFIVVGDTYGYNAIAVSPYAVETDAWIFLASNTNADEIDSILSRRNIDELLIYGYVDRDVKDALEKYNPEVIDNGDRFKDNIDIVERYLEIKPSEQIILTNGEFIEKEIMSGSFPVLFTGKENVPDVISDWIKDSDIEVGVLVGSDLVGAATNIRRSTGISVIVKFARGARNPTGGIAAVEGLDLFYLPIPIVALDIHSAKFNRATNQLELTYKSESNIPIFFKGTITPITESGEQSKIGDIDPIFIAPNDYKTVAYSDLDFGEDITTIEVFTLYGEAENSLEKILEKTIDVEVVDIIDRCEIDILGVKYSKSKQAFFVKVKNIGGVSCYVDVELNDIIIDGVETTLGSEGSIRIDPGKTKQIEINQEMTDRDLEQNSFVDVTVYTGEREDSLIKIIQGRFELKIELISMATIGLISMIIIVLITIIILIIVWRRRKEDDDDF